jgi:hypothetical protein
MSKRPPHGGKVPKPRKPRKPGPKTDALIIDDIDDAFRRIWQNRKKKGRASTRP